MGIEIQGTALLANINVRKEKHVEDSLILACDLKLEVDVTAELLEELMSESESIVDTLYTKEGAPRFHDVTDLEFDSEFKDHEITIGDKKYHIEKLNKFRAKLKLNRTATLTFRAQMNPSKQELSRLSDLLMEHFDFTIQGQPELDFDKDDEAA